MHWHGVHQWLGLGSPACAWKPKYQGLTQARRKAVQVSQGGSGMLLGIQAQVSFLLHHSYPVALSRHFLAQDGCQSANHVHTWGTKKEGAGRPHGWLRPPWRAPQKLCWMASTVLATLHCRKAWEMRFLSCAYRYRMWPRGLFSRTGGGNGCVMGRRSLPALGSCRALIKGRFAPIGHA